MGIIRSSPRSARHRGVVTVLAMMYIVLFALLAIGFYASSNTATLVSQNEQRRYKALGAAESGMDFMRYQLFQTSIPPTTADKDVLTEIQKDLAAQLNATANMKNMTVGIDAGASQIDVPAEKTQYIKVASDGAKFHATITRSGRRIIVKVVGAYSDTVDAGSDLGAVQLSYDTVERPTPFFSYGMATKGTFIIDTKNSVGGAPASHASVLSSSAANPPVTIGDTKFGNAASIAGDITVLNGLTPTIVAGSSVGGTTIQADIVANHIHHDAPADVPDFPLPDTSIFKQYASNTYVAGKTAYDNIIIKPNTNPSFNGPMTFRGVVYIQQPNKVSFNGQCTIQGVVVTEPIGIGNLLTNTLIFQGNGGTKSGVETLPPEPQFNGLRDLSGSFIVAPQFDVQLTGNFGNLSGHILGDQVTLNGSSSSVITGSLVSMKGPLKLTGNTNVTVNENQTQGHAGMRFSDRYTPLAASYDEVKP